MLIPQHMFRPRPLPRHHLDRDRVVQFFNDHRRARVILVMARAGCGKTVAVLEFVQQLSESIAWYPLGSLVERTPLLFLWNLVLAIRSALPGFGLHIEPLLRESEQVAPQIGGVEKWLRATVLPALIGEIAAHQEPLWVVLDDYHTVRQGEIDNTLVALVKDAPSNLHWLVTSRDLPSWAALWKGEKDTLAVLSDDTLVFSRSEVQELARQAGVPLDTAQIEQVYTGIGGWPILHHFLLEHCREQQIEQITATLNRLNRPSSVVYEYLAEELLQREAPVTRDFLCRTAVLSSLETGTCNTLLGITNAREILDGLANSPFLSIIRDSDNPVLIHSHDIVRDFLLQVLHREYPEEERRLYMRLGEIWEERGLWDQAISAYCQGQDRARASKLVSQQAPDLISTADFVRLETWLGIFPPEWLDQDPVLLTYHGVVLASKKSPLAEECLVQAQRLFEERGERENAIWAQIELGGSYWLKGKYSLARKLLEKLVDEPGLDLKLRRQLLLNLAMIYYGLDLFSEAIRRGQEAIDLFDSSPANQRALSRHLRYISFIYNVTGRPQEAASLLHEAHRIAESLNMGSWSLAWVDNPLAMTYQRMGRFPQAHACLDEADRLIAPYRQAVASQPGPLLELVSWVSITRGNVYRDTYDYALAEEFYHQGGRGHPHPNGVFMALYLAQQSHPQQALDQAWRRWNEYKNSESPVARAKQEGVLGLAYLNAGDLARAHTHLENADHILDQYQAGFDLISVRIFLAKTCLATGDEDTGASCLHFVLKWMREMGYDNLDFWVPQIIAELCAQAIRLNIEADFVVGLVMRRLNATYEIPFLPLVNDADSQVQARAIRILDYWHAPGLPARLLLNKRLDESIRQHLVAWLDWGWLTEEGLLQLRAVLSWRELQVFLLWVYPLNRGSVQKVAEVLTLGVDSVNTHLRNVARKLLEAGLISSELSGHGTHLEMYDWAVRSGIINPHRDVPESSDPV